jgi:hypothetical protein
VALPSKRVPSSGVASPTDAQYVVLAVDAGLSAERVFTAGDWVSQVDGGADGNLTYDFTPSRVKTILTDEFTNGNDNVAGEIGALGWTGGNVGNSVSVAGVANHPGIWRMTTAATTNDAPRIHTASDEFFLADVERAQYIVRPNSGTATMFVRVGFADNTTGSEAAVGCYFSFDPGTSANWRTVTRLDGTNITTNTTTIAYTTGTWYFLEIRRNGANEEFYINNVLQFTHSTNIPTGIMAPMMLIKTNEAVAKSIDVDFFTMKSAAWGQRWT